MIGVLFAVACTASAMKRRCVSDWRICVRSSRLRPPQWTEQISQEVGHCARAERLVFAPSDASSFEDICSAGLRKKTGGAMERERSSVEGHLVDALAPRGDEGRSTLRYASGSCEQTLIR